MGRYISLSKHHIFLILKHQSNVMKSGVILAGGKNRRMGLDKCMLEFKGKPLIMYSEAALRINVDEILVSVSQERDTAPLIKLLGEDIVLVIDEDKYLGPVHGMLSAFRRAKGDYVAVAPCDSPFIKPEFYKMLFELVQNYDGVVPMINNHWEPLHAVYERKKTISAIEQILSEGYNKPIDTYSILNIRKISLEEIVTFCEEFTSFFNINTKNDMMDALNIVK